MKSIIFLILVISLFLVSCDEIKPPTETNIVDQLPSETESTCEDDCKGDVQNKCKELKCINNECKEVDKEPCCGNDICEQGEETCEDCPSCTDYDKCTKDTYNIEEMKCYYELIEPCCGDNICETGESCSTCLDDCDCGVGLEDYPNIFHQKSVLIVVGPDAPSTDVIAGTDITNDLINSDISSALDEELVTLDDVNAVIIGTPCDNTWSKKLIPYETDCLEYLKEGQSVIKLFPTGTYTYAIVIFGYTPADTRNAATKLKRGHSLSGVEVILE